MIQDVFVIEIEIITLENPISIFQSELRTIGLCCDGIGVVTAHHGINSLVSAVYPVWSVEAMLRVIFLHVGLDSGHCFLKLHTQLITAAQGWRKSSGYVELCWICKREVVGSNLGLGYFAPRPTQPSIPPGSINVYQLQLWRQRQVWLIPLADETQGVQVKLCYPLTMRAIPERLADVSCGGAIQIGDL